MGLGAKSAARQTMLAARENQSKAEVSMAPRGTPAAIERQQTTMDSSLEFANFPSFDSLNANAEIDRESARMIVRNAF